MQEPLSRCARPRPPPTASHPAMRVALDACIQCNLCVRACREVQVNDVIGMAYRGHGSSIVFDFDDPDGGEHLRRLRRVRAGVSDGGAHGGVAGRRGGGRPAAAAPRGRERLPLLRGGVPDHLPDRRGRPDRGRQRAQRPVERAAPVRQGPVRLRLRGPLRPADPPAHSPRRRAEVGGRRRRPRAPLDPLPRGELGGGPRPRRGRASRASATGTGAGRSPGSAPPRDRTRRRTSSRR